jgi:predicted ArsR family transcriptional regulator
MDVAPAGRDDPLAHPTRARAFAFLVALRRPATIEEVAGHLGRHATGVRTQLARLEADGLVDRRTVRGPRGRPRHEWAVAPGAAPGHRRPEAYGDLAAWLAGALAAGVDGDHGLREYGAGIGRGLAPSGAHGPPAAVLQDVLAATGFRPRRHAEGAVTTYELCNCPYRRAVQAGGRRVCVLHEGITDGLLRRLAPESRLRGFVAKDPDEAGCLVEVEGIRAAPG